MENMKQDLGHSVPTYQRLGRRAYILTLIKHTNPAFGFFILSIITIFAGNQKMITETYAVSADIFSLVAFVSFVIGVLVVVAGIISSWVIYSNRSFAVTDNALKIRQGFLHKTEIAVPYRQIQDIRIERSFFQQIMGVSKVEILTAGDDNDNNSADEAILPNIDKDKASSLQMELISKTNIQKISAHNS